MAIKRVEDVEAAKAKIAAWKIARENRLAAEKVGTPKVTNQTDQIDPVVPNTPAPTITPKVDVNTTEPIKTTPNIRDTPEQGTKNIEKTTPTTPVNNKTTPRSSTINIKPSTTTPEEDIALWKSRGSNINELDDIIEKKYWTVATIDETGALTADINWEKYKWIVNEAGDSIKTKVWWENPQDIFTQLLAGQDIPDTGIKTTPAYSSAKARYDMAKPYLSMTEDQLYTAYVNWEIGQQLERDLVDNPNLAAAKEKYNTKLVTDWINEESNIILGAIKWNRPESTASTFLEDMATKVIESFNNKWDDINSFTDYMAEKHPDLESDARALNQKNEDLQRLVDVRDERLDDIIAANPWITLNRASMLAARQNKDINKQIKSMSYEIQNLQSNIQYQTSLAEKEYGYEQQRLQRADSLAREQRAFAFNALQTAQSQQFQREQIADQRAYEQANQWVSTSIINDPATGQQALINTQTGEIIKTYDTGLAGGASAGGVKDIKEVWWRTFAINKDGTYEDITDWGTPSGDYFSNLWNGKITGYGWEYDNFQWLDIDWEIWDAVYSPFSWTIVESENHPQYWNTVVVEDSETGNKIRFSHLSDWLEVNVGWNVEKGSVIGALWNTWNVTDINGNTPTADQLAQWIGSHLDIVSYDSNGNARNSRETERFLKGLWDLEAWEQEFSQSSQDWGQRILRGQAKLSDLTWADNTELKNEVVSYMENNTVKFKETDPIIEGLRKYADVMKTVVPWDDRWFFWTSSENLLEDISGSRIGQISPWDTLTSQKKQVLKKLQFILDGQTLKNLIDIKAQWWTFGALSDKELNILRTSASFLNSAANRDEDGNLLWFTMNEKEFKENIQELFNSTNNSITRLLWESEWGWRIKGSTGGRIK